MTLKQVYEIEIGGNGETLIILADDEKDARAQVPPRARITALKADPGYVASLGPSRVLGTAEIHVFPAKAKARPRPERPDRLDARTA